MFVVCGAAGGKRLEEREKAKNKHRQAILARNPAIEAKLIDFEAFGGRIRMLGKVVMNSVDLGKAAAWAERIGKKLNKE